MSRENVRVAAGEQGRFGKGAADNEERIALCCPAHGSRIRRDGSRRGYACPSGCFFPIVGEVPRFVPSEDYASSFGLQWNRFRTSQLDSSTGVSISRDRLTRLLGGSLDPLKGKNVLEAGCGAGRFTEIMLGANAQVFAVDISTAVEANYANCRNYPNYFVCQADVRTLPFPPEQFDLVICIGMIQHTPDPEETITALCAQVRPGGLLVIDHYTRGYPVTPARAALRSHLLKRSSTYGMWFCRAVTAALWPVHRLLWGARGFPGVRKLRSKFLRLSPVVDYHDAYLRIGPRLLFEWAVLDTHDTLTDRYKHLRTAEEIERHLTRCGMTAIDLVYAGNGVEARAKKPPGGGDA